MKIAAFTAAFAAIDRATGEVIFEVTKAQAEAIERELDTQDMAEGLTPLGRLVADVLCDQEQQVEFRCGDTSTAVAVFRRLTTPAAMALKIGLIEADALAEAFTFSCEGLPTLDMREMDSLNVSLAQLDAVISMAAAAEAQTATTH